MTQSKTQNSGFILIVEDDQGTSTLEAERLQPLGLGIRHAADSAQTLEILKGSSPKLMLLDYSFPGINALELIALLNKASIKVPPFIMVTGRGDEKVAVESMKAGALDYIVKNSEFLENLLPTATKALEKAELQARLIKAEEDVRKNIRLYNLLASVNQATVRIKDKQKLFEKICSISVDVGGIKMAWMGAPDKDTDRVYPLCSAGAEEGYLQGLKIKLSAGPNSKGPTSRALASGQICVVADIATDPDMEPWREKALERGYLSSAAIPLNEGAKTVAVLNLYSAEPSFFTAEEIKLLAEAADDVSMALAAINSENQRAAAQAALERTANQLTHVMEATPVILFKLRAAESGLVPEWVSGNTHAMLGYEPAEILAPGWWDNNIHPLDKNWAIDCRKNLGEKGEAHHDYRFRKKNGDYLWVHDQIKVSPGSSGEITGSWTDITQVKESEMRFQELFEKAPVGYQSLDEKGNILAINDTWANTMGYQKEEVVGRNFSDFLLPDQKKSFLETFPCFKEAGQMTGNEFNLLCKSGSLRRLSFSGKTVKNSDGSFRQTHCVFTDITDTWKAREQLDLLGEAVRSSFNEIYIFDPENYHFIFTNYSAVKNLGYAPEELEGMTPWDLKPDFTEASFRAVAAPLLKGTIKILTFRSRHRRKDGTSYPVEVKLQLVNTDKNRVFLAVINDITEELKNKQQAALNEARLESLARINSYEAKDDQDLMDFALAEAVKLTSSKLGYIYHYNEDAKEFTLSAWSKAVIKECAGRDPQTKYSLEKAGSWGEAVRQRKPIIANNFSAPDPLKKGLPDGHAALSSFVTVPIMSGTHIRGVIGVANKNDGYTKHDIRQLTLLMDSVWSILKKREVTSAEQRMIYEMAAMQRMESLGQLAGGIAHDFNNMLMGIMANISLLASRGGVSAENAEIMKEVMEAARNAQSLTTNLLAFSKGGKPVKKEFCLKQALSDIFKLTTAGTSAACALDLQKDLWSIEGDQNQVKQTINNLLLNALQAMPSGGKLKLEARNLGREIRPPEPLSPGEYIKITVTDTGIGIPEKYLTKVFDPYFSTKSSGHGLGLSMAWSVAKNHGGYITASSVSGKGTVFSLYLPSTGRCMNEEATENKEIRKGSGRILVLEDEEVVYNAVKRMLSELGYTCEIVTDGKDAVRRYTEEEKAGKPFDAVIFDLTIPGGKGGKWAIQELREVSPGVKAIVSSGYSDEGVMSDYKGNGFDAILPKPYKYEELAETLATLLKK